MHRNAVLYTLQAEALCQVRDCNNYHDIVYLWSCSKYDAGQVAGGHVSYFFAWNLIALKENIDKTVSKSMQA